MKISILNRTIYLLTSAIAVNAYGNSKPSHSRRSFLIQNSAFLSCGVASIYAIPNANAIDSLPSEVTDKIFIDFQGLPPQDESAYGKETDRIVIGLFGKDEPSAVNTVLQIVSPSGIPAKCKPKAERMLEREQLEANKVYNTCKASEDIGVTYDLSSVWRIIKDERIDVGAVSGRFIARENPTFDGNRVLRHDFPGAVSVRKGSDGGFGLTICPTGGSHSALDDDNIVIGKVLSGMDIVDKINNLPVVTSAKVNYMGLTGGPTVKDSPNRSCRYGGPMYCNENKPLRKLMISKTGIL